MFTQATLRCSRTTNRFARGGDSMTRQPYHDLLRDLPPELQRVQMRYTAPKQHSRQYALGGGSR